MAAADRLRAVDVVNEPCVTPDPEPATPARPVLGPVRRSPDGTEVAVHMPVGSQDVSLTTDQAGTWVAVSVKVDQMNVRVVGLDEINKWTELTP